MDRNSIIGLLLIGIILVLFTMYNRSQFEKTAQKENQDTVRTVQSRTDTGQTKDTSSPPQTAQTPSAQEKSTQSSTPPPQKGETSPPDSVIHQQTRQKYGAFAPSYLRSQELDSGNALVTLENEVMKITFTKRGGKMKKLTLKNYTSYEGDTVILFSGDQNNFGYRFFSQKKIIKTDSLYFEATNIEKEGQQPKVTFTLRIDSQKYIRQTYRILEQDNYKVDYDVQFVGMNKVLTRNMNYLKLHWQTQLNKLEKGHEQERRYTTLYYKYKNDDVSYLSDGKTEIPNALEWVSFKQQFFNMSLLYDDGFQEAEFRAKLHEGDTTHLKTLTADVIIPFQHKQNVEYDMEFYLGPNAHKKLASYNRNLQGILPLGWGVFGWINTWLIIPFFELLNGVIGNYGIIILIMTIVIKMLLVPLTYKSYMSMAKMRVLKPELDELKEKYEDKPQKYSQAQLQLFRKAGVNPLGGCLPMLLQMPFLVAMYRFFPASIELRHESFLWATDLSTYDSVMQLPFSIPFYGDHVSLFTLLMAGSMVLYSRINTQMSTGAGGGMQMKMMQYFMPVFMLFIFNSFASALTYYFLLSNLFSFGQQYIMKQFFIDDDKIHKQIQERKKKPKKKSKFQKKLEQIAKKKK